MKLAPSDSSNEAISSRSIESLLDADIAPLFWRADRIDARSAWCAHVPFAHWVIGAVRPETLVELGTHAGVSYAAFCHSIERHGLPTRCYAVDTWAGDAHAGAYGDQIYAELSQYHRSRFSTFSTLLRTTFDEAVVHFADGSIDLLHIDGLHTYEAVRHDFESWKPKLSRRGVILFHDTNERKDDFGVWRLWAELRDEYPSFEFLHGHGLGVLLVGDMQPESLRKLASLSEEDASTVRQRFSLLGERWEAEQQLLGGVDYMKAQSAENEAALGALKDLAIQEREAAVQRVIAQAGIDQEAAVRQALAQANEQMDSNPLVKRLTLQIIEAQKRTREAEHDLWRTRQDADSKVQAASNTLEAMQKQLASTDAARASVQRERDAERAQRMQIETSGFWRITQPARSFLTEHAGLRNALRRPMRLAFWALNGNLKRNLAARRATLADAAVIASSPLFDAEWYVQQYEDVRHSGLSPCVHYAIVGAGERRNPSLKFDAQWYLTHFPAVAAIGQNPLVHYEKYGRADGLQIQPVRSAAETLAPQLASLMPVDAPIIRVDDLLDERFSYLRPLNVYPVRGRTRRVTMVTDSISPGSLFGGVGTAIVFSTLLARSLGAELRLVTRTEEPDATAFGTILKLSNIAWDGNIEFLFSPPRDGYAVPVSDDEIYVTTSWWTTRSVRQVGAPSQIVYLLQEDERMFYPFGDERLRCLETISDPDISIVVNSKNLFEHLTSGPEPLANVAKNGTVFEPAFPYLASVPTLRQHAPDEKRRFFFYARPNNLRNLYWRGLEVIVDCLNDGTLDPDQWELHFVGKDMHEALLPHGVRPYLHRNLPWRDYLNLVSSMDVGLSLMDTPHPSYPPFDLAATGAIVVTNQHGNKTSLEQYSRNIICAETDVRSLKAGVKQALALASNRAQRESNLATNNISTDWSASFEPVFSVLDEKFKKDQHV